MSSWCLLYSRDCDIVRSDAIIWTEADVEHTANRHEFVSTPWLFRRSVWDLKPQQSGPLISGGYRRVIVSYSYFKYYFLSLYRHFSKRNKNGRKQNCWRRNKKLCARRKRSNGLPERWGTLPLFLSCFSKQCGVTVHQSFRRKREQEIFAVIYHQTISESWVL